MSDVAKLKILQIVESSSGGVGRHVIDLCEALLARGHEVRLLYSPLRIDERFRAGVARMNKRGLIAREVDMRRGPHPSDWEAYRSAIELAQLCESVDLIHGQSSKGGVLARLTGRKLGIPSVYTPHGYYTRIPSVSGLKRSFFGAIERRLGRMGWTINVSQAERDHAIQLGIPADQCLVVYNGITAPPQAPREELRAKWGVGGDFTFGYIGRFDVLKRPDLAVKAFEAAVKLAPDLKLVMIGGGERFNEIKALSDHAGIVWLGETDAGPLISAFDALLLTSDSEAFPYVIIEAILQGLPIVSSDYLGVEELVQDGKNGLDFPRGDPEAAGRAMASLANHPEMVASMRQAALERKSEFSLDSMVESTIAVYQRALAR